MASQRIKDLSEILSQTPNIDCGAFCASIHLLNLSFQKDKKGGDIPMLNDNNTPTEEFIRDPWGQDIPVGSPSDSEEEISNPI